MMRRIAISLACLAAILACSDGASAEWRRLNNADLHALYQQINQKYFRGQLRDVPVVWGNLASHSAMGETQSPRAGFELKSIPNGIGPKII
jgi:hypothetical protein